MRKKMKVREVLGSNEERKFQALKVLDSKRLDFVSRDEPTAKNLQQRVSINTVACPYLDTDKENSKPFTGSVSARLKAGLARPAQYDTAAAAAATAAATAAASEEQIRATSVRLHRVDCGLAR